MTRIVLTLVLLLMPALLAADVLLIEPVRKTEGMNVPSNGQTMQEVESAHGTPSAKSPPVGEPPITRWDYEKWSVYFEFDRVLFTVLAKGEVIKDPPSEAEPPPEG